MEGIGGEISTKIRTAIKTKLMEMGAYVDEELPDYVMVMVANKRSKAQMAEDLQLFLGKSTEQFTNWLQQVLNKLQEVTTGNTKAVTDAKKIQSRTSSEDDAAHKTKSSSKSKSEPVAKPRLDQASDKTSNHRSEKKHSSGTSTSNSSSNAKKDRKNGGSSSGVLTEKTKKSADVKTSKPKALLKAELPASAKQMKTALVTAAEPQQNVNTAVAISSKPGCSSVEAAKATVAEQMKIKAQVAQQHKVSTSTSNSALAEDVTAVLAHSTSSMQNNQPAVRRVVAPPASVIAVATKRPANGEDPRGLVKRANVSSTISVVEDHSSRKPVQNVAEESAVGTTVKRTLASAVKVTERLGVRQGGGTSIKDRLGTRSSTPSEVVGAPVLSPRLASRLGVRNFSNTEGNVSSTGTSKVIDRLGLRTPNDKGVSVMDRLGVRPVEGSGFSSKAKVTERLGLRKGDGGTETQGSSVHRSSVVRGARGNDSIVKRPAECTSSEVPVKKIATEGPGSRLAQRLRELAEGPSSINLNVRVAHVPPNNIRQGSTAIYSDRRPSVNSRIVPTGLSTVAARKGAAESQNEDSEIAPLVAVPSVVRVTPRPRLPASMQANKNLLLKAVAEAQRSVVEAAAAAAAAGTTAVPSLNAVLRRGKSQESQGHHCTGRTVSCKNDEDDDDLPDENATPEKQEEVFARVFLNRENFAVTVPNQSGAAEEIDEAEMEEQFDDEQQQMPDHIHVMTPSCKLHGAARVVVATSGEPRDLMKSFRGVDMSQQLTIQLSPEGSQDEDSSSEHDDDEIADISAQSAALKDDTLIPEVRGYDEQMVFEEEEEESATVVAAVRPTVVTTIPRMDTEQVPRVNPQFVVTLDGLDASMFPNASIDDDESLVESGSTVNQDVSKAESAGSDLSTSASSTGRATIVQRVEPRLRLGPMPSQQQQKNGELSTGFSSSASISPTKTMERCKYWPACRMGDKCGFHHPTQTCRAFPGCKFGDKCLYIHPNCKFDAACTRKDCPYTHSSPRSSVAASTAPAQGAAQPGGTQTVCRFFPSCTNPTCRFLHPKACRYGRYCMKPGCTFQHEGVPTTDKLKWVCPYRA